MNLLLETRHLEKSISSLDPLAISKSSLIAFLCNIWHLLDVITPAALRDTQFSCHEKEFRLNISKNDRLVFEELITLEESATTYGWEHDGCEFKIHHTVSEIKNLGLLNLFWLNCDNDGKQVNRLLGIYQL